MGAQNDILVQYLLNKRYPMYTVFHDVLDNYISTRATLQGRATIINSPDQRALLTELPARIKAHLAKRGESHLFKVEGSIGNGNIARVPWVGIFRTSVTHNAENGYYIVLLFAEDMSCCYLSLNQGITAVEKLYTKKFARKKMREVAAGAVKKLECHPEALQGEIKLSSTGELGRGYEAAAIESFRYRYNELPSEHIFFEHLDHLFANYAKLTKLFGEDLYSLLTVSEEEFQQVALAKAATQPTDGIRPDELGGVSVSLGTRLGTKGIVRSPIIAAEAIRAANFCCEIDPQHWTFTSRARKQKYVEAHHLIPISQQNRFDYSLDVVANIISLCATCHRMLHFGVSQEKKTLLKSLLKQRRSKLLEKAISIKESDFLELYGNTNPQDN